MNQENHIPQIISEEILRDNEGHFEGKIYHFEDRWVEKADKARYSIYSDTDSAYLLVDTPFNKFNDNEKTVEYTQVVAKSINNYYAHFLNNELHERLGLDPEYNLMNFKSEVVAYRGFFRGKKYYALAKIWDEGNFLKNPKLKKTGGQIVKSDVTELSRDLMTEIYNTLVLNFEIKDINQLYRIIFRDLYKKYYDLLKKSINNFELDKFTIPKKWGAKEYKSIPTQVKGAMLYNLIFKNNVRPGDGIRAIQIRIKNFKKIIDTYNIRKQEGSIDEFIIKPEDINKKLNIISFPYDNAYTSDEILSKLKEFDIELDFDTIIDFNIDKKIIQFQDLFSDEVKRKNS